MNKTELIDFVASEIDTSKAKAGEAVNAVLKAIEITLKKGGSLQIVGFGAFSVAKRKARAGHNPKTGAALKIPARNAPVFKAGAGLKKAVNAAAVKATGKKAK